MRSAVPALLLGVFLAQPATGAPLDALDQDGWYTWSVEAVEDAPAWCCLTWNREKPVSQTCDLDNGHSGYGSCGDQRLVGGFVQVYARVESGKTVSLRALSPECRVEARGGVTDLGAVDVDESFDLLSGLVGRDSGVSEDAVAAIAMHRGDAPFRFLTDAANGAAEVDIRKSAIFWLGQVRIAEAAGTIERLMFSDGSPDIRQHAAFVLAQSTSPNRTDALIRQGRSDTDGETRAQAWFWLAQTGARESDEAIIRAIANDPDREVREEAVFALSQLPGERAVDALTAVLQDPRLDRGPREQALFWLAQSESDRALAVLEELLTAD